MDSRQQLNQRETATVSHSDDAEEACAWGSDPMLYKGQLPSEHTAGRQLLSRANTLQSISLLEAYHHLDVPAAAGWSDDVLTGAEKSMFLTPSGGPMLHLSVL